MKKIFQILYVFIVTSILFTASKVMAFSTALTGTNAIDTNSSFSITMNLSGATDLVALDAVLSYDSNKLELISSKGQEGWQAVVASKIAATYASGLNGSGSIVTLTFKAKSSFVPGESTTISVSNVKGSNSNVERQTGNDASITVRVNIPKSSNNNLSGIKINGADLSGFSSGTTTYTLPNTDASSITIAATKEDAKATVSGVGTKNLGYGLNTFKIVVTAENGSKKTYTVNVTKNDYRSKDNTLSSLTVTPGKLQFNSNTTTYTMDANSDVEEVKIAAKTNSSKAKLSGTGTFKLKDGMNTFNVVVTAENGSKKTYVVKINKKIKDPELSSNNYLKSLTIDGYDISFNKDTNEYTLKVNNDVNSLNIDAQVEDEKATVVIKNIDNLVVGENVIEIEVTAENGDVKTYQIVVNKKEKVIKQVTKNHNCIYKYIVIIENIFIVLVLIGLVIWLNKGQKYKPKRW